MRATALAFFFLLTSLAAAAGEATDRHQPGLGYAIVFSPDLSVGGNREFYESLGFVYVESADWTRVVAEIRAAGTAQSIRTVIVESHGTNGHGMKLQESKAAEASRSYASVGGLQQALEGTEVEEIIVSACNAGRLFRPAIYNRLDRFVADPLFLPATLGILDASADFRSDRSRIRVSRRKESKLETLIEGDFAELSPNLLLQPAVRGEKKFVVSTMLIQHLIGDRNLKLVSGGYETARSSADLTREECERLFGRFLQYLAEPAPAPSVQAAR
jgi:hypothetical protein